MCRVSKIKQKK